MSRLTRLVMAITTVLLGSSAAHGQGTIAADQFVDSVGVNVHLHYMDTLYNNFDLVKARLIELGIRHLRDGLIDTTWQPYYDRHNALGSAGIKGVFIARPRASDSLLRQYPSRVAQTFEAYEAPNEFNQSGETGWAATVRASLVQLRALKSIPALARFPVYGPSLTNEAAYTTLGDVGSLIDAGNLHNYFAGHHPGTGGWGDKGYGSIDWNLALVRQISGGKPIVSTETGYWDDPSRVDTIPPDVVGTYMPRMLLEQFRKGVRRSYIYELCDFPVVGINGTSGYGLLTQDGSRKPAFNAVKALLSLLSDPGPAISVRTFPYMLQGATSDVRHMSFQKRDGSYYVAIWIELPMYDVNAKRIIAVPSQRITITTDGTPLVNLHQWGTGGSVTRTAIAQSSSAIVVTVTDKLTVLEFRPQGRPLAPTNVRVGGG
jgi:hypothetical protein